MIAPGYQNQSRTRFFPTDRRLSPRYCPRVVHDERPLRLFEQSNSDGGHPARRNFSDRNLRAAFRFQSATTTAPSHWYTTLASCKLRRDLSLRPTACGADADFGTAEMSGLLFSTVGRSPGNNGDHDSDNQDQTHYSGFCQPPQVEHVFSSKDQNNGIAHYDRVWPGCQLIRQLNA